MKKTLMLLAMGLVSINAEMNNVEKGFVIGTGVAYAQGISMEEPNFKLKNASNLCTSKIKADSRFKKRSEESFTLAVDECVKQLTKIKTGK